MTKFVSPFVEKIAFLYEHTVSCADCNIALFKMRCGCSKVFHSPTQCLILRRVGVDEQEISLMIVLLYCKPALQRAFKKTILLFTQF